MKEEPQKAKIHEKEKTPEKVWVERSVLFFTFLLASRKKVSTEQGRNRTTRSKEKRRGKPTREESEGRTGGRRNRKGNTTDENSRARQDE